MPGSKPSERAERAIRTARSALGVDPSSPGRAWPVRRLDRPDRGYWLVVIGDDEASTGVAAVNDKGEELLSWSSLPGRERHLTVDGRSAVAHAGVGPGAHAELAWAPGAISRSPLYPFWVVRAGNRRVIVDQRGGVWSDIPPTGRGGGQHIGDANYPPEGGRVI
jgi:hypothetical protein